MVSHPEEMAQIIAELHQPVRTEDELVELLSAVVHLSVRFLPGVDWGSVTTQLDGNPLTAAHTDERALTFDEHQYTLDDGPCLRAMRTQERVSLADIELSQQWPELAAAGEAAGIRSFLAAPLSGDPKPMGSLNLYGSAYPSVDEHTQDFLTVFEEFLNRGLADYAALHSADLQVVQLKEGIRSRAAIEQAKGILMAVHQIDSEQAFAMLRTQSQQHNIKLRDVAVHFVQAHTAQPVADLTEKAGIGSFSDFHSAFDHAPLGMAITDLDGTLLLVNPALAELLHSTPGELVGNQVAERVQPDHLHAAQHAIHHLVSGGAAIARRNTHLRRGDGTTVPVLASAALVRNGDHSPSHLVIHYESAAGGNRSGVEADGAIPKPQKTDTRVTFSTT